LKIIITLNNLILILFALLLLLILSVPLSSSAVPMGKAWQDECWETTDILECCNSKKAACVMFTCGCLLTFEGDCCACPPIATPCVADCEDAWRQCATKPPDAKAILDITIFESGAILVMPTDESKDTAVKIIFDKRIKKAEPRPTQPPPDDNYKEMK